MDTEVPYIYGISVENEYVSPIGMKLADTIRFESTSQYNDAMVYRIDTDRQVVCLRRPYMTHADFSYTGGVIPYIGTEDVELHLLSSVTYRRVRRGPKLK